jgi:hypothetical protein
VSDAAKRGRGRPRGPTPTRLADGRKGARATLDVDGVTIRKRLRFDTREDQVVNQRLGRMQAEGLPIAAGTAAATLWEEITLVHEERARLGVVGVRVEMGRLEKHARGFVGAHSRVPLGERPLGAITSEDLAELFETLRGQGYSRQHVKHVRNGIKYAFDARRLSAVIDAAPLPLFRKTGVTPERAVVSDEILIVYLGYVHPVARHQTGVLMRQSMSAVSRCLGGQRTNDLHVATWEDNFEIAGGAFPRCRVVRTKGRTMTRLTVPEPVAAVVRIWWEHQGRPLAGPIFPLLRGEHAGEARVTQDSHAFAMRQDIARALGLSVWNPTGGKRRSGSWVKGREMTETERPIFVKTKYTLPADFHSWRRGWVQALADAEVNMQTAAALTGHMMAGLGVHGRYLGNSQRERSVPVGVVPDLTAKTIFGRGLANNQEVGPLVSLYSLLDSGTSERARKDSNLRPLASECNPTQPNTAIQFAGATLGVSDSDSERPGTTERGHNSRPIIERALLLTNDALWELLTLATKAKRPDLVQAVSAQLDAVQHLADVTSLDAARRKREQL